MNLSPEQQEKLLRDVDEIKSAIVGSAQFKQRGLAGDVEDLKTWRDNLNTKIVYVSGIVFASCFFVSLLVSLGYEWAKAKLTGNQ